MSKYLVTGASGHLGRSVIRNLIEAQGVAPAQIIAASRDTSKLADLAAKGVITRKVDFDDAASLSDAFTGVERVLIISTDALDRPGRRLEQHKAAVNAAAKAGVSRLFYTSMPNPEPGKSLVTFAPDHFGTEQAIKASGIAYTILRNGWYMENLFMALPHALASGQWYTSTGQGVIAHVGREDIARAIAAALVSDEAASVTYTLTGGTAYTTDQIAALVRDVTGKPLEVVHVSDEQLAGGMKAAGLPDFLVPMLVSFDANTREGQISMVTGDIEKLTGKAPASLKAFLEANTAALNG
ncbi:SDR family oxidoreductase [Agrobacterium sp. a22-2]|uniref:SDR family oxidoreductase n=1 Tax=Agrobacterium sp. a22-2 TaxID=2283840 RepID=UPI001445712A|nr:SDR family oxidoreductase [Agrobacterium sp. a22-2]NKN36290.1 SDR family oxidoreductase [Agrobacterium sp. a22-2]